MTDTSKGNESVRFKSTMSKPNTSMSMDEQWVPAEHYALNVIWKRVNRHGKYHEKPMKYTEFVEAIEQYARNKQVDPFDFVWPCEPDCSKERHAYHQGQWDIANRSEKPLKTEETHTSKKSPVCNKSTGGMIVVYNHGELLHEKCYEQLKTEGGQE